MHYISHDVRTYATFITVKVRRWYWPWSWKELMAFAEVHRGLRYNWYWVHDGNLVSFNQAKQLDCLVKIHNAMKRKHKEEIEQAEQILFDYECQYGITDFSKLSLNNKKLLTKN